MHNVLQGLLLAACFIYNRLTQTHPTEKTSGLEWNIHVYFFLSNIKKQLYVFLWICFYNSVKKNMHVWLYWCINLSYRFSHFFFLDIPMWCIKNIPCFIHIVWFFYSRKNEIFYLENSRKKSERKDHREWEIRKKASVQVSEWVSERKMKKIMEIRKQVWKENKLKYSEVKTAKSKFEWEKLL